MPKTVERSPTRRPAGYDTPCAWIGPSYSSYLAKQASNNGMQRTAFRVAADVEGVSRRQTRRPDHPAGHATEACRTKTSEGTS